MPSAGNVTPWRVRAHLAQPCSSCPMRQAGCGEPARRRDAPRIRMFTRPRAVPVRKREARRGKTRHRRCLFTVMALRPGLAFAEVAGSAFCPSEGVGSAWPVRRTDSSTVGDTPPRDALRGTRHAVACPCALSAGLTHLASVGQTCCGEPSRATRRHRVAGNASEGVAIRAGRSAKHATLLDRRRHTAERCVSRVASWFAAAGLLPLARRRAEFCAKCEAEPVPRRELVRDAVAVTLALRGSELVRSGRERGYPVTVAARAADAPVNRSCGG